MQKKVQNWLIESEPWIEYRTRIDLLGENAEDKQVIQAKQRILEHPMIRQLIDDVIGWSSEVVSNHKKAGMWLHKLSFLAEIGLVADDDRNLKSVIDGLANAADAQGVAQVLVNIPRHFGGRGENEWGWALCDAPLVMYILSKMRTDQQTKGLEFLCKTGRENGWPCKVSQQLGKFRGPGRKSDPCPYATLLMLKVLAQTQSLKNSEQAYIGVNSLLDLWERSKQTHPYMFYMGTDFRKLKAPFVWYDILHFADILSQYDRALSNQRFKEIIIVIMGKANEDGLFTAESEWRAWKGFEFAQKKQPSAWITFLVYRILKRSEP